MHFTDIAIAILKESQGPLGALWKKLCPATQTKVAREVLIFMEERMRAEFLKPKGGVSN
jgi:hypothetical protein